MEWRLVVVNVYFAFGSHRELVATFMSEEFYMECLAILRRRAEEYGGTITISFEDEEDEFKTFNEAPYGND